MKSIKKIALVLPSLATGGMERVMSELANCFSNIENIEVHLILYGKAPHTFYKINNKVTIHKANFHFNDNLRLYESYKRILFLRATIKKINPTSVLSFGTQWNNFVLLGLLFTSFSVFISDRGSPIRRYKRSQEFFKTILYPKAKGIIAQTEKAKEILKKRFPNSNIAVIGNPIRKIDSNNSKPQHNIILSVGRLISSKHHDRLINIFAKIDAPDWKLIIVGGDALKEKNQILLQNQIEQLKISDKIEIAGVQKDVDQYYTNAKIFAFTSSVEGFPNVVGEALSAGLPVISYDCIAGPSEMIEDGKNGFLVSLFDDDTFGEKLNLLMEDDDLRAKMGEHARQSIKRFEKDKISQKFYDFITK